MKTIDVNSNLVINDIYTHMDVGTVQIDKEDEQMYICDTFGGIIGLCYYKDIKSAEFNPRDSKGNLKPYTIEIVKNGEITYKGDDLNE